MPAPSAVNNVASGDNVVGHVVTAAMLGDGLSSVAVWALQVSNLAPPASVSQGITAICIVVASWIMQKVSQ